MGRHCCSDLNVEGFGKDAVYRGARAKIAYIYVLRPASIFDGAYAYSKDTLHKLRLRERGEGRRLPICTLGPSRQIDQGAPRSRLERVQVVFPGTAETKTGPVPGLVPV